MGQEGPGPASQPPLSQQDPLELTLMSGQLQMGLESRDLLEVTWLQSGGLDSTGAHPTKMNLAIFWSVSAETSTLSLYAAQMFVCGL